MRLVTDHHLRGQVRRIGWVRWRRLGERQRPVYAWSVINTTTGRIVASDNTACTLAEACDRAVRLTALCREVHRRQIRLKTLQEGGS